MREVESDWWHIALPEEWESEQEDDSILIYDEDELGCISLSTLQSESDGGEASETDLLALIQQLGMKVTAGQRCQVGEDYSGWVFEVVEDGDYIREWYLLGGGHLLLASYSCAEDDREMDKSVVDQILDTLMIKQPEEA